MIRKGTKEDLPAALKLIKELAAFENASEEVLNTTEAMLNDGFGKDPVYRFFVAESKNEIVGLSLFYFRYSTWKGKKLYLEDIVVTENQRGSGIGKKLFDQTIEEAKSTGCTGMTWQVLDWNEPAIQFYKKYNTKFEDNWVNCNLDF